MPTTTTTTPTLDVTLDVSDMTERWTRSARRELLLGGDPAAPWAVDAPRTGCMASDGEVSLGGIPTTLSGASLGAWLAEPRQIALARRIVAAEAARLTGDGADMDDGAVAWDELHERLSGAIADHVIASYWDAHEWLDSAQASPEDLALEIHAAGGDVEAWAETVAADAAPDVLVDADDIASTVQTRLEEWLDDDVLDAVDDAVRAGFGARESRCTLTAVRTALDVCGRPQVGTCPVAARAWITPPDDRRIDYAWADCALWARVADTPSGLVVYTCVDTEDMNTDALEPHAAAPRDEDGAELSMDVVAVVVAS